MIQNALREISKTDLYKALTGFGRFDNHPRVSQYSGHPVNIDTIIESEMDKALVLVKKMERQYSENDLLVRYYKPCFQKIDKAYVSGDPEQFKESLQYLVDSIYME